MFRTGDERKRREKSVGIGKSSHHHSPLSHQCPTLLWVVFHPSPLPTCYCSGSYLPGLCLSRPFSLNCELPPVPLSFHSHLLVGLTYYPPSHCSQLSRRVWFNLCWQHWPLHQAITRLPCLVFWTDHSLQSNYFLPMSPSPPHSPSHPSQPLHYTSSVPQVSRPYNPDCQADVTFSHDNVSHWGRQSLCHSSTLILESRREEKTLYL